MPIEPLERAMTAWYEAKLFVEHALSVSHDALHVLAGVVILLGAALLSRRPVSDWRPWLIVLALLLFNEIVDLWVEQWPSRAMQYGESAKDLLITMALPTLILISARAMPRLYVARRRR